MEAKHSRTMRNVEFSQGERWSYISSTLFYELVCGQMQLKGTP